MKRFVSIVTALLALNACAFDSEQWLEKREMFSREAERLQAAYSNCVVRVREPAENVVLPIETFEDGSVKTMVQAAKAMYFLEEGLVWGEGVAVVKRDRDGEIVARVDAQSCVIDRSTKSGWAQGPASVTHGKTKFSGEDVYFSSPEGYVMVMRNSEIVSEDLKFGGIKP